VNGEAVTGDNQTDIATKIKATPGGVELLVADALTYRHFIHSADESETLQSQQLRIELITCPDRDDDDGDAIRETPGTGTAVVETGSTF